MPPENTGKAPGRMGVRGRGQRMASSIKEIFVFIAEFESWQGGFPQFPAPS